MSRAKNREQLAAQDRLKRESKELEHMRLRYLAREEQDLAEEDRHTLSEIRRELERLVTNLPQSQINCFDNPK